MVCLLDSGVLPSGYVVPPERVLCAQFGISRLTVRQAMSLLDRESLINSCRGAGTVATHNHLRKQQQEMRSFSEEIQARDGRPLELTRSVFGGDRYRAIAHSVRKNKSILQATSS